MAAAGRRPRGRPRVLPANTTAFTVRLPSDMARELKHYCIDHRCSMAGLLSGLAATFFRGRGMRAYLRRRRSAMAREAKAMEKDAMNRAMADDGTMAQA